MKRIGNLYGKIISLENLHLADQKARKGKKHQPAVRAHIQTWQANLYSLHHCLATKQYRTSEYTTFMVYEPKEREVFRLPYYPDRIVHHAIMNVLEPIFCSMFTTDTYSCIKGKGILGASLAVRRALLDLENTQYCLKLDIRKFYPSVNHTVLKHLLRRKLKDQDLMWLLEEIIDSAAGLPIGNYLSQYFANFYLTGFDHWLKEVKRVKYYFRYADDLVILSDSKEYLHSILAEIRKYLAAQLRLEVKANWQIFPVAARGIDFVGYVHYHTHVRLRKTIKKRFARLVALKPTIASIASYWGWAKHCNSSNLLKALFHENVQRPGDQADIPQFLRRQDQARPGDQPRDQNSGFQDQPVETEGRDRMPHFTNRTGRRKACHFHRRPNAHRSNAPG